jgi:hypothetical protein
MSPHSPLPPVGDIVEVQTTKLVERFYPYKGWLIAAETDVPVPGRSNGRSRVVGKIPIEEISPYPDFDPARRDRSWALRRKMCRALLFDSNRRFLVIDRDPTTGEVVLSLKQAAVSAGTVSRTEHSPPYVVEGFRHLKNLHYHLLKHPLGLGGGTTDWPTLLGIIYLREGILHLLRTARCPAALNYDGKTALLPEKNPCECPLAQRVECFRYLQVVRKPYERQATACIAQASDPRYPRHYHFTEDLGGEKTFVLVFMDEHCCKVVAKRREDPHFAAVTFFQVEDCDPAAPDARLKYLAERRRQRALLIARSGASDLKICTPLSWGY